MLPIRRPLQRSSIPRGAPRSRHRVHALPSSAHQDAPREPINSDWSRGALHDTIEPPAKLSAAKDPAKAKQSLKRFLERVDALGAGQQATERLLREILEGQASLGAALERGLSSSARDELRSALTEAEAGLQRAAADVRGQQAAAKAAEEAADALRRRLVEVEVELAAAREEAEVALAAERTAIERLEDELAAARAVAQQGVDRNLQLEAEVAKLQRDAQLKQLLYSRNSIAPFSSMTKKAPAPPAPELLTNAIRRGEVGEVRRLIDAGADLNAPDKDGLLPLMLAVNASSRNYMDSLTVLLKAGADVKVKNKGGQTALHWSAKRDGAVAPMQLLIEAGGSVHAVDADKETPLHHAARRGHTHVVRLLLESGAKKNARNKAGLRPWDLAPASSKAEELLA